MYGFFGMVHARGARALGAIQDGLREQRGQGTVEYVGLVLLVAALMGGMVAAVGGLGSLSGIGKELAEAITKKIVQGRPEDHLQRLSHVGDGGRPPQRRADPFLEHCAGWPSAATDAPPGACARSTIEPGFVRTADGSALISVGETRVICTASIGEDVPRWMRGPRQRLGHRRVRDACRPRPASGRSATPRRADPTAARSRSSG